MIAWSGGLSRRFSSGRPLVRRTIMKDGSRPCRNCTTWHWMADCGESIHSACEICYDRGPMISSDPSSASDRGLAPSATPAVVYGVLGFVLCLVPLIGFVFGWMAMFRSQQAAIQLQSDDRLEGHGLQRAGLIMGIAAMVLGACSSVIWLVVMCVSLFGA